MLFLILKMLNPHDEPTREHTENKRSDGGYI
jgi:hypothetical protein